MLMIDNDDVRALLQMSDCIRMLEQAYTETATGRATHRPRIDVYAPAETEGQFFRWSSMDGVTVTPGAYFACRIKADVVLWPESADGTLRETKYCGKPGQYCGLIMLFSTRNGMPLAMIHDGVLQHMRVGAGAAIGVKYLAREDSETIAILGSGGMARAYLEAIKLVRPIRTARVFSPTRANAEAFAAEMRAKLQIEILVAESPQNAIKGADIVASCTDSMTPTINPDWLEPGMHVTNVSPTEIERSCYERFDLIFRQGQAGMSIAASNTGRVMREVGQSPIAFVAGTDEEVARLPKPPAHRVGFGGDDPAVVELLTGSRMGRESRDQITFYHNFGNQGLQFACVGGLMFEQARQAGRGRSLPDEWFVQDVRN